MDELASNEVAMWNIDNIDFEYPLARRVSHSSSGWPDIEDAHVQLRGVVEQLFHEQGAAIRVSSRMTEHGEVWALTDDALQEIRNRLGLI